MGKTILGTGHGRGRTDQGIARHAAWTAGASAILALLLIAALLSVLFRAPAQVAATVLAARTQGGW